MAKDKKQVHIRGAQSGASTREAETVEQALRDIARDAKQGKLEVPFSMNFTGPNGLDFVVSVQTTEQAEEIARLGFMF